jgi:serpin B
MNKLYLCLLSLLIFTMLTACAQPVSSEVIKSEKQRISSVELNKADLSTLVSGNSDFAFNLYQTLKDPNSNLFYSPYSISLALAMTYAGARDETAQQMSKALHYTLPQSQLHSVFNVLDMELSQRGQGAKGKDGKGFRLNIVNAIWGQTGFTFLASFLDLLAENYGAGLRPLDFKKEPEESRVKINNWVSDQTENRIKDLIPQGTITPITRLVLTNAIYFNAAWQYPFKENAIDKEGSFYLLDGSKIAVPMMKQTEMLGYTENNAYQSVELPYDGRELSMIILLPKAGNIKSFENTVNASAIATIIKDIKPRQVALSLPKFTFESSFNLNKMLSQLGMPLAFSSSDADFSGMTGKPELFISDVIHKAFIAVDEAGTEAAAATALIMKATSAPQAPVQVTVDRPFIFLIRDIKTGTILFVGRILNPNT